MKKINLLPLEMQKAKDVRRVTIIIAAVQAAIFLAVVVLYVIFTVWEARLDREAQILAHFLGEIPIEQAANINFHFFIHDDFLTDDALRITQTVISGVRLAEIRFRFGEFGLTAETLDIMNIQAHIEALGEFFYYVRLASLVADDDGMYIYELNLR